MFFQSRRLAEKIELYTETDLDFMVCLQSLEA